MEEISTNTPTRSWLYTLSQWLSKLMMPSVMPAVVFICIFTCSYLRIMPLGYKLMVVGIVACFTWVLPELFALASRLFDKDKAEATPERKSDWLQSFIYLFSYITCTVLMIRLGMPWYLTAALLASLLIMVLCFIIRIWWQVSIRMAAIGGVIGALVMYGVLLGYNPVWALCFVVLLAGLLGTARIVAGGHTNMQVFIGFAIGYASAWFMLNPLTSLILQHLLHIY